MIPLNKLPNNDTVIPEGHLYELENFENKSVPGQTLLFICKEPDPTSPTPSFRTVADGTTNEDVIKALLHRLECMWRKFPSDETQCAIQHLKQALYALQSRTYERTQRGVEGKPIK